MMRYVLAALLATGILGVSSVAVAQDRVIQEEDRVVYRSKTIVDFNEVTLEGELTKP